MEKKLQDEIAGHWHTTCQMWRCKNKAYAKNAGIVFCRKHYEGELIKNYGSLKRAKKYIK